MQGEDRVARVIIIMRRKRGEEIFAFILGVGIDIYNYIFFISRIEIYWDQLIMD